MPPVEQKPASGADSPVAAQAELLRRNRELATLNLCRRHILQACDEVQLLEQVCRAMVEQGGYRMAWVGYPQDDDARSIQPTASAGFVNGYFDDAAFAASHPARSVPRSVRLASPSSQTSPPSRILHLGTPAPPAVATPPSSRFR